MEKWSLSAARSMLSCSTSGQPQVHSGVAPCTTTSVPSATAATVSALAVPATDTTSGRSYGDVEAVVDATVEDAHLGAQPSTMAAGPPWPITNPGHNHRVDLRVVTAADSGKVDVDLGEVGACQVVDGDGVGAQGAQLDGFDVVEVHHDRADIAE